MEYKPVSPKVREMFASIASRYDQANSVLSLGIHHLWRKTLFARLHGRKFSRGLDMATGTGALIPELSRYCDVLVAADFCEPMLEIGKKKAEALQLSNIEFVVADALEMPFRDEEFDFITVAFGVRNFENLQKGLRECRRVLKKGGELLILEFGQPKNPLWAALYRFYSSQILPRLGALITGNREAYTYLPETSKKFPSGKDFEAELCEAGFKPKESLSLSGGIAFLYRAE